MNIVNLRNRITDLTEQAENLLDDLTHCKWEWDTTNHDGLTYEIKKLQTVIAALEEQFQIVNDIEELFK